MSKITRDSIDMEKPDWLTQMETVLQALNEGVVIADDRNRVLFANSRFLEMTVIALQDLKDSGPSHLYSAQEWDFLRQQANAAFRTGHNRYAFVLPRKDGGRLPVIISSRTLQPDDRIVLHTDSISEVFNSQGQMLGISGVQEIVRQSSFLRADEMKQGILDGVAALAGRRAD